MQNPADSRKSAPVKSPAGIGAHHRPLYFYLTGIMYVAAIIIPAASVQIFFVLEAKLFINGRIDWSLFLIPLGVILAAGLLVGQILLLSYRLKQSSEKFRAVADVAKEFIYLRTIDGHYEYVSSSCTELCGYTQEDFYATPNFLDTLIHPDDRDHWKNHVHRINNFIASECFDVRLITKNNSIVWITHNCIPVFDESGQRIAVRSSNVDITERKQVEEKLRQKDFIIRSASSVIATTGLDGNMTYVNQAFLNTWGFDSPDEVIGRPFPEFWMVSDKLDEIMAALMGKEKKWNAEIQAKKKDGSFFDVLVSAATVFDDNGSPIALMSTSVDVSDRKRAEDMLKESEYSLSKAQKIAHIGHWKLDPVTGDVEGSDELFRIFGLNGEEATLDAFAEIVHPDDREYDLGTIQRGIDYGESWDIEHRLILKDGTLKWVNSVGEPILDETGKIIQIVGTVQDITERKKAEDERARLNVELKQKNKELEQVVYVSSHDLRTPLVNVEGYSGELAVSIEEIISVLDNEGLSPEIKARLAPFIKDSRESIEYVSKGVSKMESLLNGLLQYSRSGGIEIKKEKLDMNMLMSGFLSSFKFRLKDKKGELEISELPTCMGDEMQISQVFSNLIGNAFKYCSPDRPCIIKISGQKENDKSLYCVEDNGIGITPEYHEKIFEIFHQLNPGVGGEGLGLSIVQKIVERHNGRIWVESEPDRGSRFYVSL